MNKFMKSLVMTTAASGMLLAGSAMAADQKIGVVNFQEIMSKIPQTAVVMQKLEAEFKDEKAELAQLEKDIKYFQEKKQRDGALLTQKEKDKLDKDIGTKYQEYQTKAAAFQQVTGARQNEETTKIIALVRQAIDGIAKSDKFDLILEQKSVVFSKPKASITDKVVEQISKLN
ncbi:OmpH family outer membrane protein [Pseudocolwellia sp. HL-MZ19]|uniref:OmpH family outer membrane protein n=1 Tax=unclassified Pseudocolwellia TaxID=2848178 RepID=UPI003CEA0240